MLDQFPTDKLLDVVSAASVYPKEMRLQAARLVQAKSPLQNFARAQHANIANAVNLNIPTKNYEVAASASIAAASSQLERKIAIRMENDPEFAAIMNEVSRG